MPGKPSLILLIVIFVFICAGAVIGEESKKQPDLKQNDQSAALNQDMQQSSVQEPEKNSLRKAFSFVEDRLRKTGEDTKPSLFGPRIGTITSGSSVAAGARFSLSFLEASAVYSFRGYQEYELYLGYNPPREGIFLKQQDQLTPFRIPELQLEEKPVYSLYLDLRYHDFPQQDFYGMGAGSLEENRSDYRLQEASYSGVFLVQLNPRIRMGMRAGFASPDLSLGTDDRLRNTNELFSAPSVPGLLRQPDFWRINAGFLVDYRDNPSSPHQGGAAGLHVLWMNDKGADRYAFTRYLVDARYFQPLGAPSRLIALRFVTSLSDVGDSSQVPFYYLESLGGSHTLRGFAPQRFQDNNLMHFSAEFRFEPKKWMELALFYDTGRVFARPSDLSFSDMEHSYGAGIRFKTTKGVLVRLDGATSREGFQFIFSMGSSF